jgi:hypothetical protein
MTCRYEEEKVRKREGATSVGFFASLTSSPTGQTVDDADFTTWGKACDVIIHTIDQVWPNVQYVCKL